MKASLLPPSWLLPCWPLRLPGRHQPAATAEMAREVTVAEPEAAGIALRRAGRELTILHHPRPGPG
jgi:hypothetical protein